MLSVMYFGLLVFFMILVSIMIVITAMIKCDSKIVKASRSKKKKGFCKLYLKIAIEKFPPKHVVINADNVF